MSFFRFTSAGLLFLTCSLYGIVFREREKKKRETVSGLITDLKEMENEIRFGRRNYEDVLYHLSKKGLHKQLWSEIYDATKKGYSFRNAFLRSAGSRIDPTLPDLFEKLLPETCAFESSAEADRIRILTEKLEEYAAKAKKSSEERVRLTLSLSLLAGAAAAIIVM
ncbi:MAG: stage III sporulation protein AB [Clostridiales bacterium]|nr:stage III sporulation protein AB [Clostridiales bacterium]